jgi:hypothetical protein
MAMVVVAVGVGSIPAAQPLHCHALRDVTGVWKATAVVVVAAKQTRDISSTKSLVGRGIFEHIISRQ